MIRILIATPDSTVRETLRAGLAAFDDLEVVGLARDGHEAIQMAHATNPDIAILAAELSVYDGWQTTELLSHSALRSEVIILTPGEGDCRRAMRAGAREQLAWPCPIQALATAIKLIAEQHARRMTAEFAQAADPKRLCQIFAVSGAKGGVGKTTLATNLAVALQTETDEPTVLVDLYTQFGDVSMLLNLAPRLSLADLARRGPQELDYGLLEQHMNRHSSGLQVLVGATTPVALDAISAPVLDSVFTLLKRTARYVVLDVPPILHPTTLHALSHATMAILVANLFDLTTIKDTRLLLEAIEGKYVPREKIMLILNRVSRQNRLQADEIERALGCSVAAQLPNDGRTVPASVNAGMPFVLSHPRSPVAQSVRSLACRLANGATDWQGA